MPYKIWANGDMTFSHGKGDISRINKPKRVEGNGKVDPWIWGMTFSDIWENDLKLEELKNAKIKPEVKRKIISGCIYRSIVSASVKLVKNAKNKVIFFTYTFPFDEKEEVHQKIFLNHLKNLKTNYDLQNYLWTKELQKSGRIHYHALFDIPFKSIVDINTSFCNSIRNFDRNLPVSNNCVRLPPFKNRSVVKDPKRAARYVGKYLTKSKVNTFKLPFYQISNKLYPLNETLTEEEYRIMYDQFDGFNGFSNEFFGVRHLKDFI